MTSLQARYRNVLELARAHQVRSIAFPAISCGICGYPIADATRIAVHGVRAHRAPALAEVIFACFGEDVLAAYRAELG